MLSKGLKRKREEEEEEEEKKEEEEKEKETLAVDAWWLDPGHPAVAQAPPAVASSSLFDLSVIKLHHSLRQSEPDLRHLVLVVNTLRRIQASMAPTVVLPSVPNPPPAPSMDDNLLASSDAALSASVASLLEDLSHIEDLNQAPQPPADEGPPGRPIGGAPPSLGALDLLGPATGCLLDDGLEGLFEDIDTSMYDSELWAPASEGFKPGPEDEPGKEEAPELDEAELDYLMDVLVGTQALERQPGPGR
ncbi:SERTA domain-containing protein 1 [Marmota marmota marmota]|uniref:SERTA domain containing 1 n=1 Tax=Marmota marmota marmota TaxID=9994 RepID=A0A8C6A1U8_MARMA|nr:SERTA domain-containing protein 1 [Marmota marmota marmota]